MTLSDIPLSFEYRVHMLHGFILDWFLLLTFFSHTSCLETWARLLNGVHIVQSFKGLIGLTCDINIFICHRSPVPTQSKKHAEMAEMTNPNLLEVGGRIHEIQQLKKVHERNALIMLLLLLLFVCLDMFLLLPGFLRKITFSLGWWGIELI